MQNERGATFGFGIQSFITHPNQSMSSSSPPLSSSPLVVSDKIALPLEVEEKSIPVAKWTVEIVREVLNLWFGKHYQNKIMKDVTGKHLITCSKFSAPEGIQVLIQYGIDEMDAPFVIEKIRTLTSPTTPSLVISTSFNVDRIVDELKLLKIEVKNIQIEVKNTQKPMQYLMAKAYFPWDTISRASSAIAATMMTQAVLKDYAYDFQDRKWMCMLVGAPSNKGRLFSVKTAHIFPNHTHGDGLQNYNLEPDDVNSTRNFLRLHAEVEHAFDHLQLTFLPAPPTKSSSSSSSCSSSAAPSTLSSSSSLTAESPPLREFAARILDPSLLNKVLDKTGLAFSSLQGKTLKFFNNHRPFSRLLAAHAIGSIRHAKEIGWIQTTDEEQSAIEMARHSLDEEAASRLDFWIKRKV